MRLIVSLIMFGWLLIGSDILPMEGIKILKHYMFGDGSDMVLESSYIPKSPVIRDELKDMKIGETRRVTFKQDKDWRLSYALNPFRLTKTKDGFKIHQYIKFDTKGDVYTFINTPIGKIKIYDNWVHIKECKPFTVRYYYRNKME